MFFMHHIKPHIAACCTCAMLWVTFRFPSVLRQGQVRQDQGSESQFVFPYQSHLPSLNVELSQLPWSFYHLVPKPQI